jgi:hypothetical protein
MKKAANNSLVVYIVVSVDEQGNKNIESLLYNQLFESEDRAKVFADRFVKDFPKMCCGVHKISL